jgi:tetratricopeptide (TPR) repeat protein
MRKQLRHGWYGVGVTILILIGVVLVLVLVVTVGEALVKRHQLNALVNPELSAVQLASKAQLQQDNGDLAGAEKSLEEALVKEAKPDYESQLAVVKYRLKKYEEAIAEYQKLIDAQHDPAFAWNGMGNAYRDWANTEETNRTERRQKAVDAYRQSIKADIEYVAAYSNQALLLVDMDQKPEAIKVVQAGYNQTHRKELKDLLTQLQK